MAKHALYDRALRYVKDKDTYVRAFIDHAFDKLQAMFVYDGLPDSVPADVLEDHLMRYGHVFFTEVEDTLYALRGNFGGEPDPYDRPTRYVVSNAALKLSADYEIDTDGVVMPNDYMCTGMLPIIFRYAALMCDTDISLNTVTKLSRFTAIFTASDDRTKASAQLFLNKIEQGDLSVITSNPMFGSDGAFKVHTPAVSNTNTMLNLVETLQYYKASFLNELGLNANYNMKREYLNADETAMNVDTLLPLMDNMLNCRRAALEKINAMFGTDISVDFGSVWKATHEQAERMIVQSLTDYEKALEDEDRINGTEQNPTRPEPSGTGPGPDDGQGTRGTDEERNQASDEQPIESGASESEPAGTSEHDESDHESEGSSEPSLSDDAGKDEPDKSDGRAAETDADMSHESDDEDERVKKHEAK